MAVLDPADEARLVPRRNTTATARIDANISGARAFRVLNLLSPDEAQELAAASAALGMKPVDWEYDPSYRSCTRCVLSAPGLAKRLWERLSPLLTESDLAVRPFGFGNRGTWRPVGLTDCLRVSRSEVPSQSPRARTTLPRASQSAAAAAPAVPIGT